MSDTKTPGDKTLHVSSKTLSLPKRPAEQNIVRQSFSHGRSNAVVVETKNPRRTLTAPKAAAAPARPAAPAEGQGRPKLGIGTRPGAAPETAKAAPAQRPRGIVLDALTEQEREARRSVLTDVAREETERRRLVEERRAAEEAGRQRVEREAREAQEREAWAAIRCYIRQAQVVAGSAYAQLEH